MRAELESQVDDGCKGERRRRCGVEWTELEIGDYVM